MGIQRFCRYRIRGVPLWVVGLCGLVGVLVDIDHPISYWVSGSFCSPAHPALGIISGIILGCIGAYYSGLWVLVLIKRRHKPETITESDLHDPSL